MEPLEKQLNYSCQQEFKRIIEGLTNAPLLVFADSTKPYVLHADAIMNGWGALLNQEHPESLKPVAFASQKLSESELNYPVCHGRQAVTNFKVTTDMNLSETMEGLKEPQEKEFRKKQGFPYSPS